MEMKSVDALMRELEETLIRGSEADRAQILQRVTDLFINAAPSLQEVQIDVFDAIIDRVSEDIEREARIELSKKLAPIPNAPTGVIRRLAMDEIEVAKPVLEVSKRLSNRDLIDIGTLKGEQHILAMTQRDDLGEPVCDFFVLRGGKVATRALAANTTAKFSQQAMGVLVMRAATDHRLRSALSERHDLPQALASQIIHLAKMSARNRLREDLEPSLAGAIESAVNVGAKSVAATTQFALGITSVDGELIEIQELAAKGELTESSITDFAHAKAPGKVLRAFATLANLEVSTADQIIRGENRDSIFLVARAMGWSWETTRALIELRPGQPRFDREFEIARKSFERTSSKTATQVLSFFRGTR
ncbi:DUF2336 domain-containing protein [Bosea sp. 2KB_26]